MRNIYDTKELWKEIYIRTCPNKWVKTETSLHLDYSQKLYRLSKDITQSYDKCLKIDIHKCIEILKIWNCQHNNCQNIIHFDIDTLERLPIRNYNYKYMIIDKARSRLQQKEKNKIFLKQSILPRRLEWYDIIGNETYI